MNVKLLIDNVLLLTSEGWERGHIVVNNQRILSVGNEPAPADLDAIEYIDGQGATIMAGAIDEHVHFRDPGLTEKGDMYTESCAAVAGGVTSFIDMPNTKPETVTINALHDKIRHAAEVSVANYGFYLGANADNLEVIKHADKTEFAGIKIFLGSSTGNLLLDDYALVRKFFDEVDVLFTVHAENNHIIDNNRKRLEAEYGMDIPVEFHPEIRSSDACFTASVAIVRLARETGARLHVLHLSTADELALCDPGYTNITFETCPQYLVFDNNDYKAFGAKIKCNPAIKTASDRIALCKAVADGRITTVGTDHAPHLLKQKQGGALTAASGMPSIQFALPLMLTLADKGAFSHTRVVEIMSDAPARLFGIKDRGVLRPGAYADFTMLEHREHCVTDADVISRCGWTPYNGMQLNWQVCATWVNGAKVYDHDNGITPGVHGKALKFNNY